MKIIAVILSVYVMVLTAMPCTDVHAADTNSVVLELLEQDQYHSYDVDLCSPFCFCVCCQTHPQPVAYFTFQIDFTGFNLTVPSIVQNERECIISFFRPPKV